MYSNFDNIKTEKEFLNRYSRFKKCKHFKKWLYSSYYKLYQCDHCDNYIVLVYDTPKGSKFHYEIPLIWFSDNDDRIVSIDYDSQERVENERRKAYYRTKEGKKHKEFLKQQAKSYQKRNKSI